MYEIWGFVEVITSALEHTEPLPKSSCAGHGALKHRAKVSQGHHGYKAAAFHNPSRSSKGYYCTLLAALMTWHLFQQVSFHYQT